MVLKFLFQNFFSIISLNYQKIKLSLLLNNIVVYIIIFIFRGLGFIKNTDMIALCSERLYKVHELSF